MHAIHNGLRRWLLRGIDEQRHASQGIDHNQRAPVAFGLPNIVLAACSDCRRWHLWRRQHFCQTLHRFLATQTGKSQRGIGTHILGRVSRKFHEPVCCLGATGNAQRKCSRRSQA